MTRIYGYRKENIDDAWEKFDISGQLPVGFSKPTIPNIEQLMRQLNYNYYIFTIVENKA